MRHSTKKALRTWLVIVFFVLILIFAFFNSRDLIFGVKIKNVNIIDNQKVTENVLKITGRAKNAIKLTLNGREISIDQKGNFEETIILLSGYNVITIEAKDKFGNSDKKDYKLMN